MPRIVKTTLDGFDQREYLEGSVEDLGARLPACRRQCCRRDSLTADGTSMPRACAISRYVSQRPSSAPPLVSWVVSMDHIPGWGPG